MNFLPTKGLAQITRPRWKLAAATSLENLVVSRLRGKTKPLTRDGVKYRLETGEASFSTSRWAFLKQPDATLIWTLTKLSYGANSSADGFTGQTHSRLLFQDNATPCQLTRGKNGAVKF